MMTNPNILWIMTDPQSADIMSCADNAYVRTPNIDRIAAGGVRFVNVRWTAGYTACHVLFDTNEAHM